MFDSQPILLEQRREELIREREMYNLAREAMAGHENHSPFYADALAALGRNSSPGANSLRSVMQ
jgi:hypothetical protein